jgi:hypothetical protein
MTRRSHSPKPQAWAAKSSCRIRIVYISSRCPGLMSLGFHCWTFDLSFVLLGFMILFSTFYTDRLLL